MILDRGRLAELLADEERRFRAAHPRSLALAERARQSLLGGVPMQWMTRWAGGFPLFAAEAEGAWLTDVDGQRYLDLCLGDTGAMTGHAPGPTVEAVRAQVGRGLTFMLPTEDAVWVGEELARRFGLPFWQFALTATDANRFAVRLARAITGRPRILVFNWCYHGTVDETFATLRDDRVTARDGNIGPPVDPALTTRVVEFNDLPALEAALAPGDVACVLAEPALTNVGIVHPEPHYHAELRRLTRRAGTLLIIDETHTICAGPGGYTRAFGLEPDVLTLGKPIGGGVPCAVYGLSAETAERVRRHSRLDTADTGGIGGTLAANALATAAMRATLDRLLTEACYRRTIPLAERFAAGVEREIAAAGLPWIVQRLGCRAEYWFRPAPPRNGGEAAASVDPELERYMHLAALNRGILLTPFHNMALFAPGVTEADVDRHTAVFRESVQAEGLYR
ncbi:MAG TPA: aspartate aminotransferase family protein [Gemmatimonadales bacterium]|nr:aspartate aminotransferase family protein [Gemmatimonadales bacterium]